MVRRVPGSRSEKPPVEVGPEKNVKWKVAVPSGLSSPIVVGDKLVLTAFEERQALHDRLQPRRRQRSLAAEAPAKEIEPLQQDPRQPRRLHLRDRWRAHRFLLRLVRPVLLRPRRQGTCGTTKCRRPSRSPASAPVSRRSSPMAWSCCCATNATDPKIIALDVATGKLEVGEKARVEVAASARPPCGPQRKARKSSRPATAR